MSFDLIRGNLESPDAASLLQLVAFLNSDLWKNVTAGHESIVPNLILLETEVKN